MLLPRRGHSRFLFGADVGSRELGLSAGGGGDHVEVAQIDVGVAEDGGGGGRDHEVLVGRGRHRSAPKGRREQQEQGGSQQRCHHQRRSQFMPEKKIDIFYWGN